MKNIRKSAVLVEGIRDYIRDSIINLRFKPGEQLNELELIKKLGISRSPLREAFRHLETEGFVFRELGRGVFVRESTPTDVLEIFPIRSALESLAGGMAAPRLTERELKRLTKMTEQMEQAAKRGNVKEYLKLNFDFHRGIVTGARNKRLEEMINNLGNHSVWLISAILYYQKACSYAMSDHREILSALKDRDGKRAAECIRNHISDAAKRILEYLQPGM